VIVLTQVQEFLKQLEMVKQEFQKLLQIETLDFPKYQIHSPTNARSFGATNSTVIIIFITTIEIEFILFYLINQY